MPKTQNPKPNNKGFTLIEIVVSIFIFFSMFTVILGFLGYAIKGQKKALASQEVSNQISYVMEYIGRSIRMARKDLAGTCITAGKNYENPGGASSEIRFLNYNGLCQEFYLEDGQLKRRKSSDGTAGNLGAPVNLTSSALKVNSAQFNILGDEIGDNAQPRVTVSLNIDKRETKPEYNVKIEIQTTISQRNLDTN